MTNSSEAMLGDLSTPESMVRTLQAERACWQTFLDYFAVVDGRKSYLLATECFTEDAEIAYGMRSAPLEFHGREAYAAFMKDAVKIHEMTAHLVGQHQFVWTGGTPRLFAHVTSWQWFAAKSGNGPTRPADFVTIAHAEDSFCKVGDKWLISHRVVRPAVSGAAIGAKLPI